MEQYYLRQRYYNTTVGRFTRRDIYEGSLEESLTLHKYLYTHANPVNGTDPSGLFITKDETIAAIQIAKIFATVGTFGLILSIPGSSPVGVITQMTPEQRKTLEKYPRAIAYIQPEGALDSQGRRCFVADVPRPMNVLGAVYEQFVTKSDFQFFGMNKNETAIMYDGRTPNTRNVWETKDGYEYMPENQFLTMMNLERFENERSRGQAVASDCNYHYEWAFSQKSPYNYIKNLWANSPPINYIQMP